MRVLYTYLKSSMCVLSAEKIKCIQGLLYLINNMLISFQGVWETDSEILNVVLLFYEYVVDYYRGLFFSSNCIYVFEVKTAHQLE